MNLYKFDWMLQQTAKNDEQCFVIRNENVAN